MKDTVVITASILALLLMAAIVPAVLAQDGPTNVAAAAQAHESENGSQGQLNAKLQVETNTQERETQGNDTAAPEREQESEQVQLEQQSREYENATQQYQLALNNYNEAKAKYNESSQERFAAAKSFLNAAADRVVAQLQRVITVANANNATNVSTQMQGYIDQINNQIKPAINASANMTQLRVQSQALHTLWVSAQTSVAQHHNDLLVNRVNNLVSRIGDAQNKLNARLQAVEKQGFNTSDAQAQLQTSVGLLTQAEQKVAQAQAEFEQVNGTPGTDPHFKDGQDLMKQANGLIQQSNDAMKNFLGNLHQNIREVQQEREQVRNETEQKVQELQQEREQLNNQTRQELEQKRQELEQLQNQSRNRTAQLREDANSIRQSAQEQRAQLNSSIQQLRTDAQQKLGDSGVNTDAQANAQAGAEGG